jgi:hypothetical protein
MTTPSFSTSSAQNSDGSYKELVYAAINTRYYLQTGSYYLQTSKGVERKINNNIIYIGIPQQKYGEQIKPGTFELAYSNISITDDAKGNLIGTIDSTSSYVGNIFYTDGNAVITQTGSYFDDFDTGSFTQIAYRGQQTLYEHEYVVTINKGELNSSTNTSLFNPVSSNY